MENMRVFRDGNQIVIVLENASEALERCVMSMVNGVVPEATHLSAPRPMQPPKIDTKAMTEVRPSVKAKFIERQERTSSDMRTVQIIDDAAHTANQPEAQNTERPTGNVSAKTLPNIEQMNIFELREFLSDNQNSPVLPGILMRTARTNNLTFALNVKGEQELRDIARQLVG